MVLPEFAKVGKIIVEEFLSVKPGEEVLVVIDSRTPFEFGYVLRNAAVAAGARTTLIEIPKPPYGFDYTFDYSPPRSVIAAVGKTDVLISFSFGYSDFLLKAIKAGMRGIAVGTGPMIDEVLVRTIGEVDTLKIKEEMESHVALWNKSDAMRVTSKLGTDISIDIRGITSYGITGHVNPPPMNFEFLPIGLLQYYDCAPIKAGTLVFDGICSCKAANIRDFPSEPIIMEVKNNMIVDVKGDKKLWPLIKPQLDALNDANVYKLPAHFGIGFNSNAKNQPDYPEWERTRGTFLFGLGDNSLHFFPKALPAIKAKTHWDFQMLKPNVYLDNKLFVEDGRILPLNKT